MNRQLGECQRGRQRHHHAGERHRKVDHGHQAEVAQHAHFADDQHGEAGDRGDARGEHRRAGPRVGERAAPRPTPARTRAPRGSAPRGSR